MRQWTKRVFGFVYLGGIVVATVLFSIRDAHAAIIKEVTIETGSRIRIEDFFNNLPEDARFITDVSQINTDIPASYRLRVFYSQAFKEDVILNIVDSTRPTGQAVYHKFYSGDLPDPEDCVKNVYDYSGVVSIEYKNGEPNSTIGGDYDVPVSLVDAYGNETVVMVPFTIVDDHNAPLIYGPKDIECTVGDSIDALNGISVVDDYDNNPAFDCDISAVDLMSAGEYPVTYSACDEAGNYTETTVYVVVKNPAGRVPRNRTRTAQVSTNANTTSNPAATQTNNSGDVYSIADGILDNIRCGNNVDTARAIFKYVHNNIYYVHSGDNSSITDAAYRGFTQHKGNCFVFFSCCKILLDRAEISNMMVQRSPIRSSPHYWNLVYLNGGWYHCDSTPFRGHSGIYFMLMDSQLDSHHEFDGSLYPERAGGSTSFASPTPVPAAPVPESPTPESSTPATLEPTPVVTTEPTPEPTPLPTETPSSEAGGEPTSSEITENTTSTEVTPIET